MRVNYGQTVHGKEEINAVLKVLKNSTQMGAKTKDFELKISKLFDKKYGLMVNSGSSALLLAFLSLNLPKGSNFITPCLTFATTVASMIQAGYVPNFVDVNKSTFCISEDDIEKSINKNTKGIIIPNLLGNIPQWQKIKKISKKYKLLVIEDSADALGSKLNNNSTGKYTDISITSFYGSHIINCAGNGGMVCFNNKDYYTKAKLLRSWGRSSSLYDEKSEAIENRFNISVEGIKYDKKFIFSEIGYNLEPSELGAAFGLVQLQKLKKNINLRTRNFKNHNKFFSKLDKYFEIPFQSKNVKTGWLAYPITIKKNVNFDRTDLQIYLEKNDIQTRVCFTGNILKQPGFKKINAIKHKSYPNADYIMERTMLLACHHGLTKKQMNYIHSKISSFLKQF